MGFDFNAEHDLRKHAGALQTGDIHVGTASASLTGNYAERGESMVLNMKFAGTKMPVPELAELLPPLGIALPNGSKLEGGTATVAFIVQGAADRLLADGSLSVDKTRLANFDLGTKMALIETLAGIKSGPNTDIEILSAKLKYAPQGTTVENLSFGRSGRWRTEWRRHDQSFQCARICDERDYSNHAVGGPEQDRCAVLCPGHGDGANLQAGYSRSGQGPSDDPPAVGGAEAA